jgi:ABC-type transport system involved in cytochrome c biogenesis permease subunit
MADREDPKGRRSRLLFWTLAALGSLLNAGVVYSGVLMLTGRPTAPTLPPRIAVPYEGEAIWGPWRCWVIQEDGRAKPFDTFCREAVRTITGRERFEAMRSSTTGRVLVEGHDPVAVVVSWMLPPGVEKDNTGKPSPETCDWEHHPFVLCRNQELVRLIDAGRSGRHVEPAALRKSSEFLEALRRAADTLSEDPKVVLSPLEREALEARSRLSLYDLIRSGGAEEVGEAGSGRAGGPRIVRLDRCGPSWFSLRSVLGYAGDGGKAKWDAALRARRLGDPAPYEGMGTQPCPADEAAAVAKACSALREAYRSGDSTRFASASEALFNVVEGVNSRFGSPVETVAETELWFNRASPFQKAWAFSLAAALLLGGGLAASRHRRIGGLLQALGLTACFASLGWAAAGFYCRVRISGRPPVSNMYESLVWVAAVTGAFGLLLELASRRKTSGGRRGLIALAAALVSTLGFVLADQLPLTFSPSIQPLQAVLRSNFWLVVHVLTIVSSYAPFALAWGLGNLELVVILCAPRKRALIEELSRLCYRCIQAGVVLLFFGTMLGGFWAAESWGRFWGWDPKEVWALIALLCYVIPLHARYVGWVKDFGLAACSVVCFSSVVMAWYGVNYVLGAGLHSYGFGSGGQTAIVFAGLLNISLVVHAAMRRFVGVGLSRVNRTACRMLEHSYNSHGADDPCDGGPFSRPLAPDFPRGSP